ncbi:MAG: hypothetical protein ACOC2G_03740 [Bacillota bacterium]
MKNKENVDEKETSYRERYLILELLVGLFVILAGVFLVNWGQSSLFLNLGVILTTGGLISFAAILFVNVSRINENFDSESVTGKPEFDKNINN